MPTGQQIQSLLLNAGLEAANLVNANLTQLSIGNGFVSWAEPRQINRNIRALTTQYGIGDYTSTTTQSLYDCLNSFLGANTSTATIDPNFQYPNTTITVQGSQFQPVFLNKTQANILDAGAGNYYVPFLDNNNNAITSSYVPVFVTTGGVSITFTYDTTFSPPRIYGFANNAAQLITIIAI